MAIITLATTKGGAGKTTLARLILGRMALRGLRLAAIDADFNRTLTDWIVSIAKHPIEVHHQLDENEISPLATHLQARHDVVVIDTAGAASHSAFFAMACSDLVLIPLQPSAADVVEAIKTHNLIKLLRHPVTTRIVLMSVQPTNVGEHIERAVVGAQLPLMKTRLSRLVAFQEMSFNGVVPVSGVAGGQATEFISEISDLVTLPEPQQLAS